jgi:hypothetical protein
MLSTNQLGQRLKNRRNKFMVKYRGTRTKANTTRWEITPHYSEKLEEAKKYSRDCIAESCEVGLWKVTGGSRVHAVDLRAIIGYMYAYSKQSEHTFISILVHIQCCIGSAR